MVLAHIHSHDNRTNDIRIVEDVTFETMLLTERTLGGLKGSGFYKPSPIQLHGVPLGKCGFDLLLEAKSGTGKTAVFTVIALEKLDLTKSIQTIILAPTREIAAQICDVIKQIGSHFNGLKVEVVMGGLPVQEDIQKFKNNVHIVVGSPGRLKHLIQDNHIDISSVRLLILDEADKLMEKSFQRDINYIFSVLPKQKQVIMSSATYPECSKSFINKYVRNAQHVCPDSNSVLLGITQYVTIVMSNNYIVRQTQHRYEELLKILTKLQFKQCLIFCNYQARVGELYKMLTRDKWPAEQLYGQQEQTERLDALKTLQEYKCRILIATDLAARGIDASNVDLVIHFEPPFEWQTYLHRIGRAGRYGSYGTAITILSEGKEQNKFQAMLSSIKYPLNLRKLWTDEIFSDENVDYTAIENEEITKQSITTVPNKLLNKKTSDELWYALIGEKNEMEIPEALESFDKLHDSFDEFLNPKINSFSSLLNSFKNNQQNTKVEGNKYIQSDTSNDKLAFVDSLNSIKLDEVNQSNKTCRTFYTPELCNGVVGPHDRRDSVNDKKTNHFRYTNILEDCEENIKEGEVLPSTKFISRDLSFQCQDSQTKSYDNENVLEVLQQIKAEVKSNQRDYDLTPVYPTAFGSSKNKRNTRKQYNANLKKDNSCTNNGYENILKETDLINLHSKAKIKPNNINSIKYDRPSLVRNTKYEMSSQNIMNNYNEFRNINNSHGSYCVDMVMTESKSSLRNNYMAWYNQLKAQINQIESAIYFDEISRLYQ